MAYVSSEVDVKEEPLSPPLVSDQVRLELFIAMLTFSSQIRRLENGIIYWIVCKKKLIKTNRNQR